MSLFSKPFLDELQCDIESLRRTQDYNFDACCETQKAIRAEIEALRQEVDELRRETRMPPRFYPGASIRNDFLPIPVAKVVGRILDHLGLYIKQTPPREAGFELKTDDPES